MCADTSQQARSRKLPLPHPFSAFHDKPGWTQKIGVNGYTFLDADQNVRAVVLEKITQTLEEKGDETQNPSGSSTHCQAKEKSV